MTRILLHVGAPKTGTTAIQVYLSKHEDVLRDLGVNYTRTQRPHIAHNALPSLFRKNKGAAYIDALRAEIEDSTAQLHVISSELLFRLPMARITCKQLADHLPDDLRAKTRVVCYLRRHDRFIEALYKQFVKNGKIDPDPLGFVSRKMQELNFVKVLQTYGQVFGPENVIARPFERRAFPGGDVVRDFVGLLGVPELEALDTAPPDQINRTLSLEISEILGQVRRHTKLNHRQLGRDIIAMNIQGASANNDMFDLDIQNRIIEHFETDDAALLSWAGRSDGPFFDRSDLDKPPPAPRSREEIAASWREASSIVIQAIAKQNKPL